MHSDRRPVGDQECLLLHSLKNQTSNSNYYVEKLWGFAYDSEMKHQSSKWHSSASYRKKKKKVIDYKILRENHVD
jgi:hypothetical protein